jgi:hypothetical protein
MVGFSLINKMIIIDINQNIQASFPIFPEACYIQILKMC